MAVDFDAPRDVDVVDEAAAEAIAALSAHVARVERAAFDETAAADAVTDGFELAGADLSDAVLTVAVIPQQSYEFRCGSCFLVLHRSLRAAGGHDLCRDCA